MGDPKAAKPSQNAVKDAENMYKNFIVASKYSTYFVVTMLALLWLTLIAF